MKFVGGREKFTVENSQNEKTRNESSDQETKNEVNHGAAGKTNSRAQLVVAGTEELATRE